MCRKFLFLFLLSLITSNCHPIQLGESHPELEALVEKFEEELEIEVVSKVVFDDLRYLDSRTGFPVYGHCRRGSQRSVRIDPRIQKYGRMGLEYVVYHELGHCDLWLSHISGSYSLMRANGVSESFIRHYQRHRARYIETLIEQAF